MADRENRTPRRSALDVLGGECYGVSVTNKTHSTPTASNVKPLDVDDPRHGTTNGYGNLNCRCDDCRAANAAHHKDYMGRHPEQREKHRVRRQTIKPLDVDDPRHGTDNGYTNYVCRCDDCRAARLAYRRQLRLKGTPK